jgi:flagellar motor switch protein FliN
MADQVSKAEFSGLTPGENDDANSGVNNMQVLYDLPVDVNVRLGATVMTIKELINLFPGSVVELDRMAGESCDLYVNDVMIGKGEVVVINDNFGLRITEIISSEERLSGL